MVHGGDGGEGRVARARRDTLQHARLYMTHTNSQPSLSIAALATVPFTRHHDTFARLMAVTAHRAPRNPVHTHGTLLPARLRRQTDEILIGQLIDHRIRRRAAAVREFVEEPTLAAVGALPTLDKVRILARSRAIIEFPQCHSTCLGLDDSGSCSPCRPCRPETPLPYVGGGKDLSPLSD